MVESPVLSGLHAPETRPPAHSRPRLGFLGLGWIGCKRLLSITESGVGVVSAIADPCQEARRRAASLATGAVIVETLEELLELDLDGIIIATPSAMHASQALAALERGCAVFCQKPLARNAVETREIADAARRADRLLGVDLSYRHTQGMEQIRSLIRNGELGCIYAVEMTFHNAYGPDKPWFYDRRLSGGGCVMDLGIHLVDLALWCLDFPRIKSVSSCLIAEGKLLDHRDVSVEDYASANLALACGTSVQLTCSWRIPAGCDARIEAAFYGTKAGAAFRNLNGSFYEFSAEMFTPGRTRHWLAQPPDAWEGRAAMRWAERLSRGQRFDDAITESVQVSEALDSIYRNRLT